MRIDVLNGVNLDVLGRRDPKHYGHLTLSELETRIYAWGNQLGINVRCRQTNDEGEFVGFCHDLLDAPGQPRWGVELPEEDVRRELDLLIAG